MKFLEWKAWSMRVVMRALLFAVAAVATVADASELRVEALVVPLSSPWQRATPQQEAEDDALLLDVADVGLHLAVSRSTRFLKTDAETYFAKLREKWQALYSSAATIFWFEPGDINGQQQGKLKWLVCRRPSRESDASVFHLSTVFAGRAYSVLLFAPNETTALPKVALDLLASVHFVAEPPVVSAKSGWLKSRIIYPQANADVLEALVQDDVARLGDNGMVTGYGLDFSPDLSQPGVAWFIEGYQWKTIDQRATRVDWKQSGRLEAQILAESSAWPLKLKLQENEADVRATLRVIELCAPSQRVGEVLDQLQRGAFGQLQRLALDRATGCPAINLLAAPVSLQGESEKTVQADVAVSLPPAVSASELGALRQAGLTRTAVVEIALNAGPRRTDFGDRLVERARWYVVFEMGDVGHEY